MGETSYLAVIKCYTSGPNFRTIFYCPGVLYMMTYSSNAATLRNVSIPFIYLAILAGRT
jgi:hypothetical protein